MERERKRREAFVDCPITLKQLSTFHVKKLNHAVFQLKDIILKRGLLTSYILVKVDVWRYTSRSWRYTAAAKSLQSCLTLCDPRDGSPSGSPVPGILQARTLEWVAISFSNAWKWKVKGKSLSRVQLLATPWTAAYQAPLYMGFSRQEYWSGVQLPSPMSMC